MVASWSTEDLDSVSDWKINSKWELSSMQVFNYVNVGTNQLALVEASLVYEP